MRITFIIAIAKFLRNVADGDHDWMDPEGGKESVERLRQAGNGFGRMYMIPHAGHHGELFRHRPRHSDTQLIVTICVPSLPRQPEGDERPTCEGARSRRGS